MFAGISSSLAGLYIWEWKLRRSRGHQQHRRPRRTSEANQGVRTVFLGKHGRQIDHFLYIKIQPKTIDLSTRIWGINLTNFVFIPQSLVLRSIVLGWILIYRNWSIQRLKSFRRLRRFPCPQLHGLRPLLPFTLVICFPALDATYKLFRLNTGKALWPSLIPFSPRPLHSHPVFLPAAVRLFQPEPVLQAKTKISVQLSLCRWLSFPALDTGYRLSRAWKWSLFPAPGILW